MTLTGWGRYARYPAPLSQPAPGDLASALAGGPVIARGAGRSYGDAAISLRRTVGTGRLNRMIAFDEAEGLLVAESGVTLGEIVEVFLPRGWFPMVTPGTKTVTLGGAIASDVHGKNHHRDGAFRASVAWFDLLGPDGTTQRCSGQENAELFDWTLGGMGLTGIVTRAAIRLRRVESGWIRQTTLPCADLDAVMRAFDTHASATYSVAWIDCLARGPHRGRALLMLGEHAGRAEIGARAPFPPARRTRTLPVDLPSGLLNGWTARAFNAAYWRRGKAAAGSRLVDWDGFFYPLDAILGWNRAYGRKGFVQFQCALPDAGARVGLSALLDAIARSGTGSFLAVLKRMGVAEGAFSFPMKGYTLALDFPATRRALQLIDRLDRIVLDHGGRFYLAKDARMTAETLHAADPRAARLREMRARSGLSDAFRSVQSERLAL
ncbi:FAD-binding oxidoreductase [Palleronia abyssalis]|uniref:Delta(24)-sterol reductase n=1 Tax=Palleronia abyssalis TaxID=1501240 RepID=A0A2R8C0I1_9RHOB|nr:FAD-binding oxidoreductase [Palleronia abyssalis]SPJ25893.1 Decaprenylphosphoryl-beta-D-ribose oxidase [Palleronia abyssalis]